MKKIIAPAPRRGRPPKPDAERATRHVSIALAGALGALVDACVEDERTKAPFSIVNVSSYMKGLIQEDADRRGLAVAVEKDGTFSVYKKKSVYGHLKENAADARAEALKKAKKP
jgi:hypothetical protein